MSEDDFDELAPRVTQMRKPLVEHSHVDGDGTGQDEEEEGDCQEHDGDLNGLDGGIPYFAVSAVGHLLTTFLILVTHGSHGRLRDVLVLVGGRELVDYGHIAQKNDEKGRSAVDHTVVNVPGVVDVNEIERVLDGVYVAGVLGLFVDADERVHLAMGRPVSNVVVEVVVVDVPFHVRLRTCIAEYHEVDVEQHDQHEDESETSQRIEPFTPADVLEHEQHRYESIDSEQYQTP